jgi:hypothetical protein
MSVLRIFLFLATFSFLGLAGCTTFFSELGTTKSCPTTKTPYPIPDGFSRVQAKSRGHIDILIDHVFVGRSPMDKLIPSHKNARTADVEVEGQEYPIINYWGKFSHYNTNNFDFHDGTTVKLGTFLSDGGHDDFDSSSCNMGHYGSIPRGKTRLIIHSNPEGLYVYLDDRSVGKTPLDILISASSNPPLLVFVRPDGKRLTDGALRIMLIGGDTLKIYRDVTGQTGAPPPINPGIMQPPIAPMF